MPLVVLGGDIHGRLRRVHLRIAGHRILAGRPGINPQQFLTGFDNIARLHTERNNRARHLCRKGGLAHGLHHCVQPDPARALARGLNFHGGQRTAFGRPGKGGEQQGTQGRHRKKIFFQHPDFLIGILMTAGQLLIA